MQGDVSRAYQFACLTMIILIDCYRVVNSIINFIITLLLKKLRKSVRVTPWPQQLSTLSAVSYADVQNHWRRCIARSCRMEAELLVMSGNEVNVITVRWQLRWKGTHHFQHLVKAGGLGISQVSQQVPFLNFGTAIRAYEEGENSLS